jgi:purine-binding chemotaxis protein CheW
MTILPSNPPSPAANAKPGAGSAPQALRGGGAAKAQPASAIRAAGKEFIVFRLGQEDYGIDILKVQEIRGYDAVTTIANMPDFIKGVINLRGNIVPIVDLRLKFRLASAEYTDLTIVIILNIAARMIGIVVDSVSDVIALADEQIKPAPRFDSSLDAQYILGLGTLDDRMLILVDIERLMSNREMNLIEAGAPDQGDQDGLSAHPASGHQT